MTIDSELWRAEARDLNGCLHYTIIKQKPNLFKVITSVSQGLLFLLAMLLQCISKISTVSWFLTSFVFIMSPFVPELAVDALCLCFKSKHLIKQIHILHCLNIINLINVLPTGYFINQAFQEDTHNHSRKRSHSRRET